MQLVRFLMKMTSEYVQIELKDGTVVAGTVASVTPNMNTTLKDVKMKASGEDVLTMDTITLRGSSIRYFVLPETINLDAMISDTGRKPSTVPPPSRKRNRPDFPSRGRGTANNGSFRGRGATRGISTTTGRGAPRGGIQRGRGTTGSAGRGARGNFRERGARGRPQPRGS